jgi:ABC-type uncharacterized transport system permease subunit
MRVRGIFRSSLPLSILSALAALIVSGALTAVVGASPIDAYRQIWNGAFDSSYAIGITSTKALPLLFVALGFTVAFRAGIFNIGLEGQLYCGALAAVVVGTTLHAPTAVHLPLAVLAGAAGGAAWAALPAVLKLARGVNEIVSSLLLNYVAILLTSYLLGGPLKDPTAIYPQSENVDATARLPVLVDGTKITGGIVLALVLAAAVWWVLAKTRLGFEIRTIGASTRVAGYAGVNVKRVTLTTFLISGALGGLAGTVEILGNQSALLENFSPGWGYTGIAVALLGGVHAWGCVLAAFFFGVLGSGADLIQYRLGVPAEFVLVVQAVAVVFVLASGFLREWRPARFRSRELTVALPAAPTLGSEK